MRPSSSYDVYFRRESNGKYFLLSFLLGHSTLVREIFLIMCTDAFLVFQAHSSGHILMGVILPRILFKCRSYSALGSPLSLHPTSFLPPPSERPSLPKQSPPTGTVSSCTHNSCRNLSRTQFSAYYPSRSPS